MRIVSWNINGVRSFDVDANSTSSTQTTGGPEIETSWPGWMKSVSQCQPDIVAIQETKITRDKLDESSSQLSGFNSYFAFSRKRTGYSGVATFCKNGSATPIRSEEGLGGTLPSSDFPDSVGCYDGINHEFSQEELKALDAEGRAVITQHKLKEKVDGKSELVVINVYCPRADPEDNERETFKMKFYKLLELRCLALNRAGNHVIVLGDVNTSHRRIDHCDPYEEFEERRGRQWLSHFLGQPTSNSLSSTGENMKTDSKELDEIADWKVSQSTMDLLGSQENPSQNHFVDTFRHLHPERKEAFTCWNTKMNCRTTNFGTRIDYILVNKALTNILKDSDIRADIMGSDHCPIVATFDLAIEPSETLPSYCTANFLEFSGKQQKISSFFTSKTTDPFAGDQAPPPAKKLKTAKQSTLSTFFVKKHQPVINEKQSGPLVKERQVAVTQVTEKVTQLSDVAEKSEKNCQAVTDWKRLMKGPPPAPLCQGHKEPCVGQVVKKAGPNQGRKFWVCARGVGKEGDPKARCNFFLWQNPTSSSQAGKRLPTNPS